MRKTPPGLPLSGEEQALPHDMGQAGNPRSGCTQKRRIRESGFPHVKWLTLSAAIIILDQISKLWINSHFAYGESLHVTDFFNLVLAYNTGAAFSMLNDAGGWQRWLFTAIAVIVSAWIVRLLGRHGEQKLFCFALALILGGALGNLVDRISYGHVVDFLDFHWDAYHFAAFNIADSAITCGAALLLLDSFLHPKGKQ